MEPKQVRHSEDGAVWSAEEESNDGATDRRAAGAYATSSSKRKYSICETRLARGSDNGRSSPSPSQLHRARCLWKGKDYSRAQAMRTRGAISIQRGPEHRIDSAIGARRVSCIVLPAGGVADLGELSFLCTRNRRPPAKSQRSTAEGVPCPSAFTGHKSMAGGPGVEVDPEYKWGPAAGPALESTLPGRRPEKGRIGAGGRPTAGRNCSAEELPWLLLTAIPVSARRCSSAGCYC